MPSYFYHISFEVLRNSNRSTSSPLAIESAWEAISPFQKRNRPADSTSPQNTPKKTDKKESIFSSRPSSQSSCNTSTPQTPSRSRPSTSTTTPSALLNDLRSSPISIQCIDMVTPETSAQARSSSSKRGATQADNLVAAGIGTDILGGLRTKGRYIPLDAKTADSVWGIVHLYRDATETPYLAASGEDYPQHLKGSAAAVPREQHQLAIRGNAAREEVGSAAYPFPVTVSSSAAAENSEQDCSTLCVLAVPSYLSGSDFLGFVGERTLDEVSHFRMIRTPRANRYMVLMKFRSGRKAMEWQKEWNGKVFNSMEPETCHVVFVKSVEIQVVEPGEQSEYTPSEAGPLSPSTSSATLSSKPLAPRTPALVELPTCPVCLERMDETTGLLTIICQHVFHCTCLQKWKGSGCPVCRYTQDDFRRPATSDTDEPPAECSVCHSDLNLWTCLICGTIGCGRYDGAHAFEHWKATTHAFAMDLTTQRVWDYVGDAYVHRIIQSKTDGKLVELPAADHSALDPPDWGDAVPREKLENMSVEYTHLLTSQLESQRAYFEEVVERAADKASQASASAAVAEAAAGKATGRLEELQAKYDALAGETIPGLERDRARLEKRAEKFEGVARSMEKDYREEKTMNQSLMERVKVLSMENEELKAQNLDLAEQNRDLTFFISSSQKLQGESEDVVQGTVSVPEPETKKKRNKGKGRK